MSQCPVMSMDEYHAHDEKIANEKRLEKYAFPCTSFCGGKRRKIRVIYEHMLKYGHNNISPFPKSQYLDRIQLKWMRDADESNIDEEATNEDEQEPTLEEWIEVDRMLNDVFNDDWDKLVEDASKLVQYLQVKLLVNNPSNS